MRRSLVLGNWKMNGRRAQNAALVRELVDRLAGFTGAGVGVCPPFPYIGQVAELLAGGDVVSLGAQNVAAELGGAFTGEVSASMLADMGCRYVLIGHSERRALYGETDATVAEKFARVVEAGMVPVLCVGEMLSQRERELTLEVVTEQVQAVVERCALSSWRSAVIAYEPVWAIGTGLTATPEQAQQVHGHLRKLLAELDTGVSAQLPILYGGSVNASNAADLFAMTDIDGALVGGASLTAKDFCIIARAAGD